MAKRTGTRLIALCVIAAAGFVVYAWHPAIKPVSPPSASTFPEDSIQRGALIAATGYCAECHTRKDGHNGPPLAGDYRMETPFGAIFSSNITPDPKTGIGTWSEKAFLRAMRKGISRDGHQLYPAFPFDHFTKMTDRDIADLYAWLMTQPAVEQKPRHNTVRSPFNVRFLQAGWKLLFLRSGPYRNNRHHDALWNRGAYLAEGAAHCGACHTPRNALGAEKKRYHAYDGADIDGWIAPPLNAVNPAPLAWTEEELYAYLRTGTSSLHGSAAGPMGPVVHTYLKQLPDNDIHALARYFADKAQATRRERNNADRLAQAMQTSGINMSGPYNGDDAARLYRNTCAACHANEGTHPVANRPELALSTALWLDEPTNLFQIMLRGTTAQEGHIGLVMPSFATALTNKEMARIAAYLRRTRTTRPPWENLERKAAAAREQLGAPPVSGSH